MHSRSEVIRQALAGMKPEGEPVTPVTISGHVSQVNVISHATINIESLCVVSPEQSSTDRHAQLEELVNTLAALESYPSAKKVTPEAVWFRLKHTMGISPFQQIPAERHQEAIDLMVYRLSLARGDLQLDPDVARRRSDCYRRCHGIAKQYGLYDYMRRYMDCQWGAKSMRGLSEDELKNLEKNLRQKARERKPM